MEQREIKYGKGRDKDGRIGEVRELKRDGETEKRAGMNDKYTGKSHELQRSVSSYCNLVQVSTFL